MKSKEIHGNDNHKPSVVDEILNWNIYIPLPKGKTYEVEIEFIYMGKVKPPIVDIYDED